MLGALITWIVGRWLIGLASAFLKKALERGRRIDLTLATDIASIVSAVPTLVLILAIFQIFGVQTTSLAALLAGLGLAIGTGWGGLLAHFAAGVFLQVLHPFKVGDFVTAGCVTGTVSEVALFFTKIVTPDNVETIVGNNAIFSATIPYFSALPYRRVDSMAKIANTVDARDPQRGRLARAGHRDPELRARRPAARGAPVYAHGPRLQVYFDTNRAIADVFVAAGYPIPTLPIGTTAQEKAIAAAATTIAAANALTEVRIP